jgi:MFS family permease
VGTVDELWWVFLLPALIGMVCMVAFVVLVHEEDSRTLQPADRLSFGRLIRSYGFRPREFPQFAWNWAGRSAFFFAVSLTSSYTTFFYAHRLGITVAEVVTVLAVSSALSILSTTVGALGAGWLSDRLGRRRPFMVVSGVLFLGGCAVSAFAHELPMLLAGAFTTSLGIAVFVSVNQAIVLDVLPHRDTQAGRYMAIAGFSQKVPSALAPLVAPLVLATAPDGGENYAALYLTAGCLALVGGLLIAGRVRTAR